MATPPRRNLPPDAEAWGRYVDNSVQQLNTSTGIALQSVNNTLAGVNATINRMTQQIQELQTTQAEQAALFQRVVSTVAVDSFQMGVTVNTNPSITTRTMTKPAWANAVTVMGSGVFYVSGATTGEGILTIEGFDEDTSQWLTISEAWVDSIDGVLYRYTWGGAFSLPTQDFQIRYGMINTIPGTGTVNLSTTLTVSWLGI